MNKKSFRELFAEAERDPVFWTVKAILRATEEIFLAMERQEISRAELARRLGSSPAYVTKALRGNANFTLATLARIAFALEGELEFHISPREPSSGTPARRIPRARCSPRASPSRSSRRPVRGRTK